MPRSRGRGAECAEEGTGPAATCETDACVGRCRRRAPLRTATPLRRPLPTLPGRPGVSGGSGRCRCSLVTGLILGDDPRRRACSRYHRHAPGEVTLQGRTRPLPAGRADATYRSPGPSVRMQAPAGSRARGFPRVFPPGAGSNEKGAAVQPAAPFEAAERSATAFPGQRPRAMIPSWISIYVVVPAMNWLRFEPGFAWPYAVAWLNCPRASWKRGRLAWADSTVLGWFAASA